MTRTPDLIDALVETATPVRRLRVAIVRAGLWLAFAAIVLGLIAIAHGLRAEFSDRVQQPLFVLGMLGALATSILAALASCREPNRGMPILHGSHRRRGASLPASKTRSSPRFGSIRQAPIAQPSV